MSAAQPWPDDARALEKRRREVSANLRPAARAVLDVLVGRALRIGSPVVSLGGTVIAEYSGLLSKGAIASAKQELVEAGVIALRNPGQGACSVYTLVFYGGAE